MSRHLDHINCWIDLASEVFVVDSRSTDGTMELIMERLQHPRLSIISRDRGLYQSWNEGIHATSGDWVYISTAGDTIEREHLSHLLNVGEQLGADVVVSNPRFILEDGSPHNEILWPPLKLIQRFNLQEPALFDPDITQYLALESYPDAILGSSASNLYRGTHIRARPFPTDHGRSGDTAWIVRFSQETRFCVTPREGSTFCVHAAPEAETGMDYAAMLDVEIQRLLVSGRVGELARFYIEKELPVLRDYRRALFLRRRDWPENCNLIEKAARHSWSQVRYHLKVLRLRLARFHSRRLLVQRLKESNG